MRLIFDNTGCACIAAELLDSLIRNGRKSMQGDYTYGAFTVVERDTTIDVKGAARLVTAAQKIIHEKACGGITPQGIADALNVSRRLIEMRFREVLDVGVAEAICAEKLKEVCRRLNDTNRPIDEISYACGFETPTHLKALFRKTYGTTMRAWRTQSHAR
ncbi:MAG: AraC family transcriptional regulator [Kiritimatiellae bacterium]|nr:AraC family transcriptional regulator [Kiritimatiellia bacterium]